MPADQVPPLPALFHFMGERESTTSLHAKLNPRIEFEMNRFHPPNEVARLCHAGANAEGGHDPGPSPSPREA